MVGQLAPGKQSELDTYEWEEAEVYGEQRYKCHDCPFTIFNKPLVMEEHCRRNGHGIVPYGGLTLESYVETTPHKLTYSVNITLGYLCWNTAQISAEGVAALVRESERLGKLGCNVQIVILDNGSTDDTFHKTHKSLGTHPAELIRNVRNFGISPARNQILDAALDRGSHYVLLMDGDIEVVPLSVFQMVRYLECHPTLGCIGAYSSNCTPDRLRTTAALYEIPESRVKHDIRCAWTQYGLFRCKMFQHGMIRFDEDGPFGEPGWGYEDDDLYWQMQSLGWGNKYFSGMTYLHRAIHSSFKLLKKDGVSLEKMFQRRKEYLLTKLRKRGVDESVLQGIEAQSLPKEKVSA